MAKRLSEYKPEVKSQKKVIDNVNRKLTSKSRDTALKVDREDESESWKYDLPAYQFRSKSGKKMKRPIRDDTLIGGFSGMGRLSEEEALHQEQELRKQEAARKKEEEKARQRYYNPFDGFDDAFSDSEENYLIT